MGAAHRWCLRAAALAGMASAFVGALLPGCQFPNYTIAVGGSGGASQSGGMAGATPLAGEGGRAGGGTAGVAGVAGDGGAEAGDGGAAGAPVVEWCATEACTPKAPNGWQGPIALWEVAAGSTEAPDCPPGYTSPIDLHRGIAAPVAACKCTCSAQGQSCDANTTVDIYTDMSCATPCTSVNLSGCTRVPGSSTCTGSQGSLHASIPAPSGGSCVPNVAQPVPATWQFDARLCEASQVQQCDDSALTCAPTPPSPYEAFTCVKRDVPQGDPLPACPAGFPNAHPLLYAELTDDRVCTECRCGALSGGSCAGTVTLSTSTDCSGSTTYTLGEPCKAFNLGSGPVFPRSVRGDYVLTPGSCGVATASKYSGTAVEKGAATLVCCRAP